MDVALISSPVDEAREKLEEYLTAPGADKNPEWQRIATAYQSLAMGTPLVVLSDVIRHAPRDARGRPRLAIARADQVQIKYSSGRTWSDERFGSLLRYRGDGLKPGLLFSFPRTTAWTEQHGGSGWVEGYSIVPIIPPSARKRANGPMRALNTHFVLWEVEAWADQRIGANPDRDPYLLQRIADDLFAVVGEWDLTDVERAIMRDRARS